MTEKELKEYRKEWKRNNKDSVKRSNKKYYEAHKEQFKEYQKRWNEKNKEKVKEMHHNYYVRHKEEMLKQNKEWCRKNSAKKVEYVKMSRRRRVERLRSEGCTNAWGVVSTGATPKYKENKC